ncbi:MAG: hypothetical protein JW940_06730 [Polyangiaceae bacterium]|nr:hypothetical protein [Polyangiaceae bacterium]
MQAPSPGHGFPLATPPNEETPAQALVRLLEEHGLEESLRAILAELESRGRERQQQARREILEYLQEGQPPVTPEELEAARREWQE